jgi:quinoprotein relay system zinc metallohydrolase 2
VRRPLRSLAGSVLLLAAVLAAAPAKSAPLTLRQVAPGVYVHIGGHKDFEDGYDGDIANIGFVVGSEAVAVIDTGGAYAVGSALKEALRAITPLPVRWVINTHGHPDHVFGNAAFVDANAAGAGAPPQFIGHANLPRMLSARGDVYTRKLRTQLGSAADKSALIAPARTVRDRLMLDLGGRKLELRAWPDAHTNSDLTVFDLGTRSLWTGDLLFIERTPSLDGDAEGWLAAMDALDKLPAAATIPGHGPVTRDKHAALARQRAYLQALLRDVRGSIRQGAGMTAAMATAAASERTHWQLFDAVNPRNVNQLYPVLEWE